MKANILIVEDDPAILELISYSIKVKGYKAIESSSAEHASHLLSNLVPNLIIIDWMLPGASGIELIKNIKLNARLNSIPLILLTAKSQEEDKMLGFESGIDDYITKPFSPNELTARITAILKRTAPHKTDNRVKCHELNLDPSKSLVYIKNKNINLNATEFKLLHFFLTHQDKVFSRAQILDHVWGYNVIVSERAVDVNIRRLRQKIEYLNYDKMIRSIRGSGYIFSTNQ